MAERFADGKVTMPYKNFLGYDKGKDGKPVINEKEAEIVRLIYRLFLQGKTASGICKHLDGLGTPTSTGRKAWNQTTINSILRNEKYKGDALLQKKFTVGFLTKKQKVNEGEIPQYYVEDNHPAIIDPLEFDMVQAEIARRQKLGRSYSGASIFSSKVICGECGSFYGQKIRHSNDPYRKLCGVATESSTESMCAKLRHWTLTKSKKSLLLRIISCSAIARSCLKPASLCVKKLATALP